MATVEESNCNPELVKACAAHPGWWMDPVACVCRYMDDGPVVVVVKKSSTQLLVVGAVALALMWTFSRRH